MLGMLWLTKGQYSFELISGRGNKMAFLSDISNLKLLQQLVIGDTTSPAALGDSG